MVLLCPSQPYVHHAPFLHDFTRIAFLCMKCLLYYSNCKTACRGSKAPFDNQRRPSHQDWKPLFNICDYTTMSRRSNELCPEKLDALQRIPPREYGAFEVFLLSTLTSLVKRQYKSS